MATKERAADCTRDPIWVVQERRIIVFPRNGWEWDSEAEGFYQEHEKEHDPEDGSLIVCDAEAVFETDADSCVEVWETRNGYFFLSRLEAQEWAERISYNLSREGWRVYCMALPRESSLTRLLREHAPTDGTEGDLEKAQAGEG